MYYIYMLRCQDNSLYTGITNNINRRLNEHFSRNINCAKYTKSHRVKKLEALWITDTKSSASKLEYHLKKLSKSAKEELIIKNNLDELLYDKIDINMYKRLCVRGGKMKKVELLSPVGNKETLPYAIHNGCSAVYLAGKSFGARKYADNFTNEELKDVVSFCRLYGVKVYVTVNTLIFDDEINSALEYIDFLYKIGVDALIMQDIGLIKLTHDLYPDLEIHISTQCHNHNIDGLNFFKRFGATRVVLDRELSKDEIKNIDTDMELEVFVYGALCICYSGCCFFSSLNGGRSGNRGECVASCRMPYELYKNDKLVKTNGNYLLSTKELNTLSNLRDLLNMNIASFKIEGRMKSPEYVGYVTSLFRKMIDNYYDNKDMTLDDNDLVNLKKLYNRGFTKGYLFNDTGNKLMNITSPNHIGVELGKVIDINKKYIKIFLNDDLNQEDGIRLPNNRGMIVNKLYNDKLLLVNSLKKGDIAYLDNKIDLKIKGTVLKTIDKKLNLEISKYEEKKIPISFNLIAKVNNSIKLEVNDGKNIIIKEYGLVEKAVNRPMSKDEIIKQISKVGNTIYKIENITSDIDNNIFISIKDLNELRRITLDALDEIRKSSNRTHKKKNISKWRGIKDKKISLNILVRNEKQLLSCLKYNISSFYTDSKNLYLKYKDKINIYLRLPRIMLKHPEYHNEKLLISEIGALEKYHQDNLVRVDYTNNITNLSSSSTLEELGAGLVTLSPEVEINKIKEVDYNYNNIEYIAYGRLELMISKYCLLKMIENNDQDDCKICDLGNNYYLKDKYNNKYPIINTKHYMHIYHKETTNNIDNIKICLSKGITNYRIELFDEEEKEIDNIIRKIIKELGDL